ncbi:MAG: Exonuclease RNase and polymerase [Thermoleophilia bacterium]|nr:Exonuclease RNase and polymerase [Thermoleophilia bacterium]
MRWAAIDFETATHARDSACALGVVVVDDGVEHARQAWLIRPPDNEFFWRNVEVHGIRPEHTETAPVFDEVWSEALELIGDRPLVAHNASFDVGVIRGCCATFGLTPPPARYLCTVQLARRTWPQLGRHKLPIVAAHVGAPLDHHDALSDATACSRVLHACIEEVGATSVAGLVEHHKIAERRVDGT